MTTTTETNPRTAEFAVGTYENNGYHDSYFYAITFNPETCTFNTTETASTAHCGGKNVTPATAEVLNAAEAALADLLYNSLLREAANTAAGAAKGVEVRSLTTRGKNVGIRGTVVWIGPNEYRPGGTRVGVKVEGEDDLRYLDGDKVLALNPLPVDAAQVRDTAEVKARRARSVGSWYFALRDAGAIRQL